MENKSPKAGQDYWPDANAWPAKPQPKPPTMIGQAVIFILIFVVLQSAWLLLRDQAFGHFIRGDVTVKPAVRMINLVSPHIYAIANGNQIQAQGGGIVVKLGCEGLEALCILIAAIMSVQLKWQDKFKGVVVGIIFIYFFNQLRILALFYAFRLDKALFYFLHGTVAPIVLVALSSLFFYCWLKKYSSILNP